MAMLAVEVARKKYYTRELFKACKLGDNDMILKCLDNDVNINININIKCIYMHSTDWSIMYNSLGSTPLLLACNNNQIKSVELLLEKGADINISDNIGQTPLYIAAYNNYKDLLKLLIKKGAIIDKVNDSNMTPLHVACCMLYTDIALILVQNGADINKLSNSNCNPVYNACGGGKGSVETVSMLIEHGADVNIITNNGFTPLCLACIRNKTDLVRLLLLSGADRHCNGKLNEILSNKKIREEIKEMLRPQLVKSISGSSSPQYGGGGGGRGSIFATP